MRDISAGWAVREALRAALVIGALAAVPLQGAQTPPAVAGRPVVVVAPAGPSGGAALARRLVWSALAPGGGRGVPTAKADDEAGQVGAAASTCPDVAIYGTRGSGEQYLASEAGMGPTVARVSDRILRLLPSTMRVLQIGLNYPAVDAYWAVVGNSAIYKNSISSGADTFAQWLGQEVTRCPHVKIVLIGLSQGANVIDYMLTAAPQPTPVTRRIAAILLYGDPVRQPGKSYNVGARNARGALVSPGLQPPTPHNVTPSIPPYLAGVTQSYCLAHDPICGFTPSDFLHHLNVHATYGQSPYVVAGAAFAVAHLTQGQGSSGGLTRVVVVPGSANIFGAGHATAPDPGGYHVNRARGGGTLPPSVTLPVGAGRVLTVAASGGVSCDPGAALNGPDGGCGGSTDINSYDGIAGIIDGQNAFFLMGVFLGPTEPHDPAPPRLDFSTGALGQGFSRLSPAIGQSFFIGDGLTGTGTGARQQFVVPAGATRLFLGFADTVGFHGAPGWYDDNRGQLSVTVRVQSGASGGGTGPAVPVDGVMAVAPDAIFEVIPQGDLVHLPLTITLPAGSGCDVRCLQLSGVPCVGLRGCIRGSACRAGCLNLTVPPAHASWVAARFTSGHALAGGAGEESFDLTLQVPPDVPVGYHDFTLGIGVNGAPVAAIPVSISVLPHRGYHTNRRFLPSRDGFGFVDGDKCAGCMYSNQSSYFAAVTPTGAMCQQEFGQPCPADALAQYRAEAGGGACAGFAASSVLHFLGVDQTAAGPYALDYRGTDLSHAGVSADNGHGRPIVNSIAFYQGAQYSAGSEAVAALEAGATLDEKLGQINLSVLEGEPILVFIYGQVQENDGIHEMGHTLVAYGASSSPTSPDSEDVRVYDPNKPGDNGAAIHFRREGSGWHWSYDLGPLFNHLTWTSHDAPLPLQIMPAQALAQPGVLPGTATDVEPIVGAGAAIPAADVTYAGATGLRVSDALGRTTSVSTVGHTSGGIPGATRIVPQDGGDAPGSGEVYLPETSAFTVTETPGRTGTLALRLAGPHGIVAVAVTGRRGVPVTLRVGGSDRAVAVSSPAAATVSVTFEQAARGSLRTVTVSGVSVGAGRPRIVQVMPGAAAINVSGGVARTPYALALTRLDRSGRVATAVLTRLAVPAGGSQSVRPHWSALSHAATVSTVTPTGRGRRLRRQVRRGTLAPDARVQVIAGRGGPAAPGRTLTLTVPVGTFRRQERLSIVVRGLVAGSTGRAGARGGLSLRLRVPASAMMGSYVVVITGRTSGRRAAGVIVVVRPRVSVRLLPRLGARHTRPRGRAAIPQATAAEVSPLPGAQGSGDDHEPDRTASAR